MSSITYAELAVYTPLSLPILYIIYRHGRRGITGWLYLFIFCTLRIVGAALEISATSVSSKSTAVTISNVGLSPLVLAIVGILHEARLYRNPGASAKIEWLMVLFLHVFIALGIALVATASSTFTGHPTGSQNALIRTGIMVLEIAALLICILLCVSFLPFQKNRNASGFRDGSMLLYAVVAAWIFLEIRLLYTVVIIFVKPIDLENGPLGLRWGLSFVPEVVAVVIMIVLGSMTRNIARWNAVETPADSSKFGGFRQSAEGEV